MKKIMPTCQRVSEFGQTSCLIIVQRTGILNIYLTDGHKTWLVPSWWSLIAYNVCDWQSGIDIVTWEHNTPTNNHIHPCTTTFFWGTRVRIKVKVRNGTTWWIFYFVEADVSIPDLQSLSIKCSGISWNHQNTQHWIVEVLRSFTGAAPSAGSMSISNSFFVRLKRPSITFGNGKYERSSSCRNWELWRKLN